MPFEIETFPNVRPYLYHLTSRENLPAIRKGMNLRSAVSIASAGGVGGTLESRRKTSVQITVDGSVLNIRDQGPLYEGNMLLAPGWTFGDVLRDLNRRVFFWPGTAVGPISYGARHFERYAAESPVVLRVRTQDVFSLNADRAPEFCRYNSGSPRCSGGKRSPRGPDTFRVHGDFDGTSSNVVEVTFVDRVALPAFEVGVLQDGVWVRRD